MRKSTNPIYYIYRFSVIYLPKNFVLVEILSIFVSEYSLTISNT